MAVNSKNKGNTYERKIANLFSSRFEKHTGLEASFTRNIDSGSFFGASNQKRIKTHGTEHANFGDILTPANFRFTIECKHYKTPPSFAAMMKQEFKLLDTWIGQATQDAENSGKEMLAVVKFNNVPDFVVVVGDDPDALMHYRGHSLIALDKWLERKDDYFFV